MVRCFLTWGDKPCLQQSGSTSLWAMSDKWFRECGARCCRLNLSPVSNRGSSSRDIVVWTLSRTSDVPPPSVRTHSASDCLTRYLNCLIDSAGFYASNLWSVCVEVSPEYKPSFHIMHFIFPQISSFMSANQDLFYQSYVLTHKVIHWKKTCGVAEW